MLASAPMPQETSAVWSEPRDLHAARPPRSLHELACRDCPVCGSNEVACDEVMQLGTLRLSECRRCRHRWTERGPDRWAEVGAPMKRTMARRTEPSRTSPPRAANDSRR